MSDKIEFGARFAPDGSTWVDADNNPVDGMTDSMSVERQANGEITFICSCQWEGYGITLTAGQVVDLKAFLSAQPSNYENDPEYGTF